MDFPKITVGVVLYHGLHYLEHSMPSLLAQEYPGEIEFLFRDQSPNQEAKLHLEHILPETFPGTIRIEAGDNRGHSGGHNCLMRQMTGDYYVCASNDMWYAPDALSKVITGLQEYPEYAVATAKSLVWDFAQLQKTNRIDSVGIGLTASHYFYDIGQGEEDVGQYDGLTEIFGPSGALMIISKKALEDIAYHIGTDDVEYYDETIHYKNDIDIAYRLFWADKKTLFTPEAKVWHDRQLGSGGNSARFWKRLQNRREMKRWAKTSSFFGQLVVLQKHVFGRGHRFSTKIKSLQRFLSQVAYSLLFEPYVLAALAKYISRQKIIGRKKAASPAMRPVAEITKFFGSNVHFGQLPRITKASAIVLDFFKGQKVVDNIRSLLRQKVDFSLNIMVSDNSCDEENATVLQTLEKKKDVEVVLNDRNLGYPKGNNVAAKNTSGEVIFIINPDIQSPDDQALQKLADYLAAHHDVAIVGPKQKNPDGSYERTARRFPDMISQIARRTPLKTISPFAEKIARYERQDMDMQRTQDVEWLQSSFWAVRKDFWDYLGGFDEYYYVFMSDVEMCYRAWQLNMRVVYLADVQVEADGIRSSAGSLFDFINKRLVRIHMADALRYYWRHIFESRPQIRQ